MARKTQALSYFTATLTQGGADAFIQAAIATALSGQTKVAYRLASLEVEWPRFPQVDQANHQLSLTRKSFAAMSASMLLEKSTIFARTRQVVLATAVGTYAYDRTERFTWSDEDAPIIVEDPIYAQFDSAATALVNVCYIRLGYWQDTITELDKLSLVANSLS